MTRTVYVVQRTPAEAPPGSRGWADHWESESSICAHAQAIECEKDHIFAWRVVRRVINETVISGPEE